MTTRRTWATASPAGPMGCPPAVLGVILFLAGVQLALGSKDAGPDEVDRFVVLTTAAFAVWNVGIAVLFGLVTYHAAKRGWLKLS